MTRRHRVTPSVALAAVIASASGCATSAFDQHLRAGQWTAAVAAFEADSSLLDDPRAVRRAAYLYAAPDSASWNPLRAAQLLSVARAARQPGRPEDRRLEAVLLRVAIEREERQQAEAELGARIAASEALAARDREQLRVLLESSGEREMQRAALQQSVARLEADLRERELQLLALRTELERLKQVDLGPAARAPSTP